MQKSHQYPTFKTFRRDKIEVIRELPYGAKVRATFVGGATATFYVFRAFSDRMLAKIGDDNKTIKYELIEDIEYLGETYAPQDQNKENRIAEIDRILGCSNDSNRASNHEER